MRAVIASQFVFEPHHPTITFDESTYGIYKQLIVNLCLMLDMLHSVSRTLARHLLVIIQNTKGAAIVDGAPFVYIRV